MIKFKMPIMVIHVVDVRMAQCHMAVGVSNFQNVNPTKNYFSIEMLN